MALLLLLNGPNLNLLGSREPHIYGSDTLADVEAQAAAVVSAAGHTLQCLQSNAEHVLIERIHRAATESVQFLIFNPGGFTHTSVALRDALLSVKLPFIEVHLSNPHARESFRHHSYFSDIAVGTISGCGALGYELAARAALQRMTQANASKK
jgi:3-dehydroquinate dehydratase II